MFIALGNERAIKGEISAVIRMRNKVTFWKEVVINLSKIPPRKTFFILCYEFVAILTQQKIMNAFQNQYPMQLNSLG